MKKIRIAAAVVGVVVLVAAAVAWSLVRYRKVWDVPLPATRAVQDPAAIARGRYIVYSPGRCADCHAADAARPQLLLGEDVPLTGGSGETTEINLLRKIALAYFITPYAPSGAPLAGRLSRHHGTGNTWRNRWAAAAPAIRRAA